MFGSFCAWVAFRTDVVMCRSCPLTLKGSPFRWVLFIASSNHYHSPRKGGIEYVQHARKEPWRVGGSTGMACGSSDKIYAGEAAAVALCRVVYGGGGKRQMVLEAICGMIGSSLIPVLEYLTLPANLATFAGCMVGFVGVEKLRDYSDRFMSR